MKDLTNLTKFLKENKLAHFYAKIQGNRGEATRTGTKNSGITADIASWSGSVHVELWKHDNGKDYATVWLRRWQGKGIEKMLYQGPVGEKK